MSGKPQLDGIVRDKNGVPKFDDPKNASQAMKNMLTDDDLRRMDPQLVARLGLTHRLEK